MKARFERITVPFLAVDTERDTAENLRAILDFIAEPQDTETVTP